MAFQITSLTIMDSTIYSGVDQRKHQSSASLAFVRGIHRWPVNSPHKGPVTRNKCFHLMTSSRMAGVVPTGNWQKSLPMKTNCSPVYWRTHLCHRGSPFLWRHNGCDSVSNHQPHHCLLNRLIKHRSKKTSKLRVTGLCAGIHRGPVNSPHKWPVTRKMFPFDDVIMLLLTEVSQTGIGMSNYIQANSRM